MSEQASETVDLEHLQGDQIVYGSDGQPIGHVAGITADLDTGEPYLEVGAGLFKTLYVPRSAIETAVLGKPVRLKVPRGVALERFTAKPNVL